MMVVKTKAKSEEFHHETSRTDDDLTLPTSPADRSIYSFDTRSEPIGLGGSSSSSKTPSLCSIEEQATTTNKEMQQSKQPPTTTSTVTPSSLSFLERMAQRVARSPKLYFWGSFLSVLTLSAVSMYFGNFKIQVNNVGWPSRGTLISNRHSQVHLMDRNRYELSVEDNDCIWEDMTTHVQLGWEVFSGDAQHLEREEKYGCKVKDPEPHRLLLGEVGSGGHHHHDDDAWVSPWRQKQREELEVQNRVLVDGGPRKNLTTLLNECYVGLYSDPEVMKHERLWPVWKLKSRDPEASLLDPPRLRELCEAEENTQRLLQQNGYCYGCKTEGQCLPPYSPVVYARFIIPNGFVLDCQELAEAWIPHQHKTEERWKECVAYIKNVGTKTFLKDRGPCPEIFSPSLVDSDFDQTGKAKYTSTLFMTKNNNEVGSGMYAIRDQFDRGSDLVEASYDTNTFRFLNTFANDVVFRDILFATGSAVVTTLAMLIHTRSPFLTLVGVIQIGLSFPLAYGIYRFLGGLVFFPFLNLIGIFVAFALGADHIFVAVDKWKNARRERPNATTEEIAIHALPSAAKAMVLTTTTTAVAFFGSALCPIASIRLFAVFCGLLIALDYIVDVLVMFPCLCIFDAYRHTPNYFVDWRSRKPEDQREDNGDEGSHPNTDSQSHSSSIEDDDLHRRVLEEGNEDDSRTGEWRATKLRRRSSLSTSPLEHSEHWTKPKSSCSTTLSLEAEDVVEPNLIQRILVAYYNVLHTCRWGLLVVCMAALALSWYGASTFSVPDSTLDIQLVDPRVEYERARDWRQELFLTDMVLEAGSTAYVAWGLTPADTGDHSNPLEFTTLELDETFDPSSEEAQVHMREFCDKFYAQEFAMKPNEDTECTLNMFDSWLEVQSSLPLENQTTVYVDNCGGASGIPVPKESLHSCLSSWAHHVHNQDIMSWNGTVKIISLTFASRVRVDSHNKELGREWHSIESWMETENAHAPMGVSNGYFSSKDFWLWDTSYYVYRTALDSGAIAIALSAIVIILSSRSISITFFSAISVVYVLVSVTALMSAAGWTLGFLESICFTILIGLSADFVIHFSHAYTELPGDVDRHTRTKHAVTHLGPSVLAAGFTTLAGAAVMLFTTIYFFRIFAMVLFFAIIQATVGSFVVFLVLTDCMGPSNPTYLFDKLCSSCPTKKSIENHPKNASRHRKKNSGISLDSCCPNETEVEPMEYLERKSPEKQELKQRVKQELRPRERSVSELSVSSSNASASDASEAGSATEGMVVDC